MPKTKTSIGGHDGPSGSASMEPRTTAISSVSDGSRNTQQGNAIRLPQTNEEMPPESEKGSDAGHGNRFQSKLLMLFCIRAIIAGYNFFLATELVDQGKKFDDLILNYKKAGETGNNWYKYLQAKSRLNEKDDKITAEDLFPVPEKGQKINVDFSLLKYFQSYLEIARRGDKIDSCIICTNIDFANKKDLQENGIKVKEVNDQELDDPILKFEKLSNNKIPKRYKIEMTSEITQQNLSDILRQETTSKLLAEKLYKTGNLNPKSEVIRNYHVNLVKEKVIDITTKPFKFHVDFIEGSDGLSEGAIELRQNLLKFSKNVEDWKSFIFSFDKNFGKRPLQPQVFNYPLPVAVKDEEIIGFLDKLIFAVNTPNEDELDDVLKSEVGKYYKLLKADLQSAYIMNEMVNWFKRKHNVWLSSKEAEELFFSKTKKIMESLRVTDISINYQNKLKEALEFNDKAIGEMGEKLETLFASSPNNIGRIGTLFPKRTAVKVIAALEKLKDNLPATNNKIPNKYFQFKDSNLVTSSSGLQNEMKLISLKKDSKFVETLQLEHSHHLLVVVCEDGTSKEIDEFCIKLFKDLHKKRLIIISQDKVKEKDELNFIDLSGNFQLVLLKKEIEFQGSLNSPSVGDLIKRNGTTLEDLIKNGGAEKILDSNSIEELIARKTIEIPSGSSARFEENLYIEMQLELPLANFNQFYNQLANRLECTTDELKKKFEVDSQGNIKWFVEGVQKNEIWKKMTKIVKKNSINSQSSNDKSTKEDLRTNDDATPQEDLITKENGEGKVFILNGIAGTGKSTILSNYCEKIKKENPHTWVIKIDLLDYLNELKKFSFSPVNKDSAIEFFVEIFAKNSPFARSLLTHRFQTDGRIVVMLDGYDEIGDELREKVFQLTTSIKLTKVDALYLTTRSHLKEELQDKLFQFSYTLKKFSQRDQIDCLSKYWTSKLKIKDEVPKDSIQSFGERLVTRLSTTLKDKERDFIGIPLQCRMLAEIYETQLIKGSIDSLIQEISTTDLDLTSLYSDFMEKKFEIYVSQKLKTEISNDQLNLTLEFTKNILDKYLRKLAIKTIVIYSDDVDVLLGKSKSFVSRKEMRQEEKYFTDVGVGCGFLGKDVKGEKKFLHRTYAEYLFAKYLHDGFLPEKDENYNKLLTSQPVRETIFRTIFVDEQYEGVRTFFDSFLLIKGKVKPTANLSEEIEKSYEMLGIAIRDQNAHLFTFLCKCLDLSLGKLEIQNILHKRFEDYYYNSKKTLMYSMYMQNSEVLDRFISYYKEKYVKEEDVKFISRQMFERLHTLSECEPNLKEMEKNTESVIRFLVDNRETTKIMLNKILKRDTHKLGDFFVKKHYSSLLKTYIKLLSKVYCEDKQFEKFLLKTIRHIKDKNKSNSHGNLKETLIILRDLERNKVLEGISCQIFRMDAQLFKRFYKPKEETSTEDIPTNIKSLLERDSYQMTRLHRAALHGDEETVNRILKMFRICCSSRETRNTSMEVLDKVFVNDKEGITPLYVAAACERENIFKQMLKFLTDVLPIDGNSIYYLTEVYGFLSNALWDAMKWEKVEMFRLILKSVKEILGQGYLINLMTKTNPQTKRSCYKCKDKIFFNDIVEFIVDGENGYKDLNDLLFENMLIEQFQCIDNNTLQKIFSAANGMEAWIKRLLDTYKSDAFNTVLSHLLEKFNDEQRPRLLLGMITSDQHWLDAFLFQSSMHFMSYVSKCDNLGQSEIKKLLTRNDNRVIKEALFFGGEELVNKMLYFLSNKKDRISIKKDLANIVSKYIEDAARLSPESLMKDIQNILDFVLGNVDKFNLSNLVEIISRKYTDRDEIVNLWSVYLIGTNHEDKKIDNFLKCISNKKGKTGKQHVEKLVEHENDHFFHLFLARTKNDENLITVLLSYLSEEKRDEIEQQLVKEAPEKIKKLSSKWECKNYWTNILQYVVKHADSDVLLQLIKTITKSYKDDEFDEDKSSTTSIWRNYLLDKYHVNKDFRSQRVYKFLQHVSEKLGKTKVKKLVMHKCDDGMAVLHYVKYYRKDTSLVEAMLTHLTEKDREEVWCEAHVEMSDEESDSNDEEMSDEINDRSVEDIA